MLDEAHERGVNTDILLGILSRVVRLRRQGGMPRRHCFLELALTAQALAEVLGLELGQQLLEVRPLVVSKRA